MVREECMDECALLHSCHDSILHLLFEFVDVLYARQIDSFPLLQCVSNDFLRLNLPVWHGEEETEGARRHIGWMSDDTGEDGG